MSEVSTHRWRRNRVEAAMHFVWATFERRPLITPELEPGLHACIAQQAQTQGAVVLAVNGMADHVHLAVLFPATVTFSDFMKQVKGVSSAFARDWLGNEQFFRWQGHYSVFAFSRSHRDLIVEYIERQKAHHASGTLRPELEKTDAAYHPEPANSHALSLPDAIP